jgi:[ribosomal protein S5]-alanine N-acetyltransferase
MSLTNPSAAPRSARIPIPHPVLRGSGLSLREFAEADINERYLGWLTDPVVNEYSQRRFVRQVSRDDALAYLRSLRRDEVMLAIVDDGAGHVGNIKYGPVDWTNRRADISILIGERSAWGKGVGAQAVQLVTDFVFGELDLNRVEAGSNNPAFLRLVQKLGWRVEGILRERIWTPQGFRDHTLTALLRHEIATEGKRSQ